MGAKWRAVCRPAVAVSLAMRCRRSKAVALVTVRLKAPPRVLLLLRRVMGTL